MTRARDLADQADGVFSGDVTGTLTGTVNGLNPQASNMQPYNILINGGLDIWQRGTYSTATGWGYYTADRWKTNLRDGAGTASQYVLNGQLNPFVYAHKLAITSAATTSSPVMQQNTEDSRRYKGQTVTLSFYATASKAITLTTGYDLIWANTDNFSATTGHALTTSWQRFTVTTTLPDPSGTYNSTYDHLLTRFYYPTSDTYDVYITGVQLEAGSTASPFAHEDYGTTLQKCQRYYLQYEGFVAGTYSGNSAATSVNFPVQMRASPTVSASNPINISQPGVVDHVQSSANATIYGGTRVSQNGCAINMANFSGLTSTLAYVHNINFNGVFNALIFSAEL